MLCKFFTTSIQCAQRESVFLVSTWTNMRHHFMDEEQNTKIYSPISWFSELIDK